MDLIVGSFADNHVPQMGEEELGLFGALLDTPDPDLYDWISGQKPVPANRMNPVIEKLLNHDYARYSPLRHSDDPSGA